MPYKLDSFDKQIEHKNGIDPQRLISETSSRVKSSFAPRFGPFTAKLVRNKTRTDRCRYARCIGNFLSTFSSLR